MNKKLLAAAIAAGLAAPAMANAAPTLYGHLQAEIAQIDRADNNTTGDTLEIEDNKRGRLGVKGDEDLGGGLSAIYMFEWQVETTKGNVSDGNRESWVGLKGGFGAVKLGALQSAYKYFGGVSYDPLVTTLLEARNNGGMFSQIGNSTANAGSANNNEFGANGFLTDAIGYEGTFGPATIWAEYQMSEVDADGVDNNLVLGLKLNFGAVEVVLAHAEQNDLADGFDNSNDKIGAKFKFGEHSIAAQYEAHSDDVDNNDATAWFVNATLGFGKHGIILQAGATDTDQNGNGVANADRDYAAVAYRYKFSKQTSSWVGYRTTDHKNGNNILDTDVLSAGLRITF
jgi:predicted porin